MARVTRRKPLKPLAGNHPRVNPTAKEAKPLRCPYCGSLEFWTEHELHSHGLCRTNPAPCPICGQLLDGEIPA